MSEGKSASLKAELKAWESAFRASHKGANPTKDDIKANPAIAEKYKIYSKSKAPPPRPVASTSASSSVAARVDPLPSNAPASAAIFKTPTKPRPKMFFPSTSSTAAPAEPTAALPSPQKTGYVVANSPSKLRALAGAHSLSGSPNRKGGRIDLFQISGPSSAGGSPKKVNPFSRPADGQDVRRDERGENFFGAPAPPLKRKLSRRGSSAPATQEVLLVADPKASGHENRRSLSHTDVDALDSETVPGDEGDDDDDILGPSPVKPSASTKVFKPLLNDDFPSALPRSSSLSLSKTRKIFEAEFNVKFKAAPKALAKEAAKEERKRGREAMRGPDNRKAGAESSEDEDNDGEEPVTKAAKIKREAKSKAKSVATGTKRKLKKPKMSHQLGADEDVEMDSAGFETKASVKSRGNKGTFVLDIADSEEEDHVQEKEKETVIVGPRKTYGQTLRAEEDDDELLSVHGGRLLYEDRANLLATNAIDEDEDSDVEENDDGATAVPRPKKSEIVVDASLPSSLLSLLSINNSPVKSQRRERDRELAVKKLLQEPSFMKEKKGLVDLADEAEDEADEGDDEDNDWESETEGWEGIGDEKMDGYDED